MDTEIKMVISRGKVTFSRTTATRCSTWSLLAGDDTDKILNVMEDILVELRYQGGFGADDASYDPAYDPDTDPRSWEGEDEIPVSDGVAFQPPRTTVLGGEVFLGNSEPTPR